MTVNTDEHIQWMQRLFDNIGNDAVEVIVPFLVNYPMPSLVMSKSLLSIDTSTLKDLQKKVKLGKRRQTKFMQRLSQHRQKLYRNRNSIEWWK